MGRKKRKVVTDTDDAEAVSAAAVLSSDGAVAVADATIAAPSSQPPSLPLPPATSVDPSRQSKANAVKMIEDVTTTNTNASNKDGEKKEAVKASHYAMTSHSGEIVGAEVYVSSGSEDEDDNVEVVLSGSKMGLMRKGLIHQTALLQPNLRQWTKPEAAAAATTEEITTEEREEQQRLKEEEELANLDPAERAARLLAEKQRKLEEAKEKARRTESEENAGRDPCLFSKRTAFDIRFDQIDDKPWERGAGDLTDFFNYGYVGCFLGAGAVHVEKYVYVCFWFAQHFFSYQNKKKTV